MGQGSSALAVTRHRSLRTNRPVMEWSRPPGDAEALHRSEPEMKRRYVWLQSKACNIEPLSSRNIRAMASWQ